MHCDDSNHPYTHTHTLTHTHTHTRIEWHVRMSHPDGFIDRPPLKVGKQVVTLLTGTTVQHNRKHCRHKQTKKNKKNKNKNKKNKNKNKKK